MNRKRILVLAVPLLALLACAGPKAKEGQPFGPAARLVEAGAAVEVNWKERRAQPYVYIEQRGDYRRLGDAMRQLLKTARELEILVSGPPFALFYDDPANKAPEELRARACLPVSERPKSGALSYEELPSAMVVYGRVSGPYPELPRSYSAMFQYMNRLGWTPGVPIREIYLVDPGQITSLDELVAEVQVPWSEH